VLDPPAKTIKCAKAEVTYLAIAPKGDRILVCHEKGAELRDLETGKRIADLPYDEDETSTVYYGAFNENGEYVVLIGFTGKREVWDVKTGKRDKDLAHYKWIPDAIRTRQLGLKLGNSPFDRFYQQTEATEGGLTAHAVKDGAVVFTAADGNAVQTLSFPENKDRQHLAPCLFWNGQFITATDDGRVLFYDLAKH
jgi:WD40 repeat protein